MATGWHAAGTLKLAPASVYPLAQDAGSIFAPANDARHADLEARNRSVCCFAQGASSARNNGIIALSLAVQRRAAASRSYTSAYSARSISHSTAGIGSGSPYVQISSGSTGPR